MNNVLHVGLDVGSTTVKIIVMDNDLNVIYRDYQRHFSDTKNTICYVLEKLINCMLDTTEKNIIPILRSLDLKDITLEEVDEMHPKEIHELFKSFAGDFFIKLYIYGGFGLIFGVNVYLSIILFIIDIIYTKQIDLKVEQSQGKLFRD